MSKYIFKIFLKKGRKNIFWNRYFDDSTSSRWEWRSYVIDIHMFVYVQSTWTFLGKLVNESLIEQVLVLTNKWNENWQQKRRL